MKSFNVVVQSNGQILWTCPDRIQSTCQIDVTFFPFDQQVCELKFGSWTFSKAQLDVVNASVSADLENYIRNAEWELIAMPASSNDVTYEIGTYSDVTYKLVIRRKPLYYLFNLLLPCILIVIINTVGLYLPPESGEKISLGVTVLLSLTVFLLIVAENTPTQSEVVPLIGK